MRTEYVIIIFMIGVAIGGVSSALIWDNKCKQYEKEIEKYNKHIKKEYKL